ncbi:MAG: type II toxin-antitoxin system VapC family toxin [Acaryochloridaceae cyanobacterium CSU_3_4]|nr:type II toxin-antitoxin system VapC family toxin [Acaryochloridaceae cyanobacterium CSU_3_4]
MKMEKYVNTNLDESNDIINLAKSLNDRGLKKIDALHIACAIAAGADYFLTTDKGILKKAAIIQDIHITDPIDFIREVFP